MGRTSEGLVAVRRAISERRPYALVILTQAVFDQSEVADSDVAEQNQATLGYRPGPVRGRMHREHRAFARSIAAARIVFGPTFFGYPGHSTRSKFVSWWPCSPIGVASGNN